MKAGINRPNLGKEAGTKTAMITFAFKKDIYNVYNELNFVQYDNHRIYF